MDDFQAIVEERIEKNEAIGVRIQVEKTDQFSDFFFG